MTIIKKLIMMGILAIPFMLLTKMAKAQDYSKMPSEVQVQMSQNKSEGKDLLSGIYVHYELQFGGVENFESSNKLQEILSTNLESVNYFYNDLNKHVSFVCEAKYDLKALKSFLKNENIEINHLHKQVYSLEK